MDKTIYQVYYTSKNRNEKYSSHGFGDYIRGTILLYQFLKNKNINLKVNFSNHNLSHCFICDNNLSIHDCEENVKYIYFGSNSEIEELCNNQNKVDLIFTINWPISEIDKDCKDFIIKNCLTPKIEFGNKILLFKNLTEIKDYEYSIIHIRLNDDEQFNQTRLDNILKIITSIQQNNINEKFVLITSNKMYLDSIHFPFIIKTNLEVGHLGHYTTTVKECEDTMIEFMLMTTTRKIYQLSVYSWGSGFSDTINRIYNIEIENYNI